jgi:antitoxin HicB
MQESEWVVAFEASDEDGEVFVRCPDLPEVLTAGKTVAEALANAEDAVVVAIGGRMRDEADIPLPRAASPGDAIVVLPAAFAAKLAVWRLWRRSGLTKVALAGQLGLAEAEVRRILDPGKRTKLDRLDAVARVLGRRLTIESIAA